jgi:hypothetical protein
MKARYFTYGETPKAVYYLSDIKSDVYPTLSVQDFIKEIEEKWITNPDVVIVDDRNNAYSSGQIETFQIEDYLSKLENLKNYFDKDDEF